MQNLSWKRYDDQYKLSELLTEAARACVDARASHPGAFLASYFTKVTSGDSVDAMECEKVYTPNGELGLRVRVRLFTNACVSTTAFFNTSTQDDLIIVPPVETSTKGSAANNAPPSHPEKTDAGLTGPLVNGVRALHDYLNEYLIPDLRQIGVNQQKTWDNVLDEARWEGFKFAITETEISSVSEYKLPSELIYAISLAASIVSSRSSKIPLYGHFGSLYAAQPPITMLGSKPHQVHKSAIPSDHYVVPRLLLPFFGRSDTTAVGPPGSVCFQTFYLIPAMPAPPVKVIPTDEVEGGDAGPASPIIEEDSEPMNPKGLLTEEMLERLIMAYRVFSEKFNNPPLRQDGAYVYMNAENISDAVQMAAEVVTSAGLKPGVDVCFGVRINCPIIRHNPEAVAASNAPSGKGKRVAKDQGKLEEVMYTLFSGDPEVTGAQVSEYLAEQVSSCNGTLVFLEDTHDAQNAAGIHRLMTRVGDRVVVSGRSMYKSSSAYNRDSVINTIETGITSMWSNNFSLGLHDIGSISRVMGVAKLLNINRRCYTLRGRSDDCDATNLIDLSIGFNARYVIVGGLTLPTACDAVAYFIRTQKRLLQLRAISDQPPLSSQITFLSELPPLSDEPIAEIKRKNDKKKKKQPGKH